MNTMTLSEELTWRGQVKDKTFQDLRWLDEPQTYYFGSDCSSDSLTIGNLAMYMVARRFRKHGWNAVLLVGGATSLVGDPGGKDEERQLKPREEIQANVRGIKAQVEQIFSGMDFTLVDNYDWFKDIGYLEFLRDVGKHFSMTELLQRDFISSRIGEGGSGISYAEFSYSLIQGYDYWHLYKQHKTVLQIGGSDQWGNMLSGVPLIRKKENVEVHAFSAPLVINKSTGKKFGKSEDGAVWLDPQKTSIYKFYQFWLNVDDDRAEDFLKIYTELDKPAIEHIMNEFSQDRAGRKAQKTLAQEVTKLVHGEHAVEKVKRITEVLFGTASFLELSEAEKDMLAQELPTIEAEDHLPVVLVKAGLASSNTEATRFLNSGAISINDQKWDQDKPVSFKPGKNLIKRGKNTFAIVTA